MSTSDAGSRNPLAAFVGVVAEPRTYGNLAYLLLAFPLALFYTVFLSVGYSLGFGLSVLLVGVPLLAVMVVATFVLAEFERELTGRLLGVDLPSSLSRDPPELSVDGLTDRLFSETTMRGGLFLMVKSAFGFVAFTAVVTLLATSLALVVAPLEFYDVAWVHVQVGFWTVDSLAEALAASGVGVVATLASLHLLNALAAGFGRLSAALLEP